MWLNGGSTMRSAVSALAPGPGPFELKLSSFSPLTAQDLLQARGELCDLQDHPARSELMSGSSPAVRLVTAGWVGVTRVLPDGRRQILQLALAGDLVTCPPLSEVVVVALSDARSFNAGPLVESLDRKPVRSAISQAMLAAERELQADLLNHAVRLGSLTAYERTANFIVELVRRYSRVGLCDGGRIPWPATQEVLSHILGLSIVHVNRMLQHLRQDKLITTRLGTLTVLDIERLEAIAMIAEDVGLRRTGSTG